MLICYFLSAVHILMFKYFGLGHKMVQGQILILHINSIDNIIFSKFDKLHPDIRTIF